MPSTFDTRFASFPLRRLLSQFGETISYTAYGSSAASITAIIDREPIATAAVGSPAIVTYTCLITIAREDLSAVKVGADTVAFKRRLSDSSNTTFRVSEILDDGQYGGAWRLGVR